MCVSRDGVIGAETIQAVAYWQAAIGLSADGKIGPNTRNVLDLVLAGHDSVEPKVLHPLPSLKDRWGYQHAELTDWPYHDTQLEDMTASPPWGAEAIRLVSGYDAENRTSVVD